jgi:hypothetical protein
MKTRSNVAVVAGLSLLAYSLCAVGAQQKKRSGNMIVEVDVPGSFAQLFEKSHLIAEGAVESVLPAYHTGSGLIYTDILFRIDRLYMGVTRAERIVISVIGGRIGEKEMTSGQVHEMEPGRQFILFLVKSGPVFEAQLPKRTQGERFSIVGGYAGAFAINGSDAKIAPGLDGGWFLGRGLDSMPLEVLRARVAIELSVHPNLGGK